MRGELVARRPIHWEVELRSSAIGSSARLLADGQHVYTSNWSSSRSDGATLDDAVDRVISQLARVLEDDY